MSKYLLIIALIIIFVYTIQIDNIIQKILHENSIEEKSNGKRN